MDLNRLSPETLDFYRRMLTALNASGARFLVGGAYALERHTGIERHTKDLDLFVREVDFVHVLGVLESAGCRCEHTFTHWLGKACLGDDFLDIIYCSGNGLCPIDDGWFEHGILDEVLGIPVRLCPPEEMIWQKAFIMERERFDGADVAHLIRARAEGLDWHRLLRRFGPHGRVLLAHLTLFGYIYPAERWRIPAWVPRDLLHRLQNEMTATPPTGKVCRGTLLSRAQYLVDVERWGYHDARLAPDVAMSADEIARWTEAIDPALLSPP